MTFLIDAQLPPLLAEVLTRAGYLARHVEELGLRQARDEEIWRYAVEHQMAVMTKDFDFFALASAKTRGPAIVWLRFGNCNNARLVENISFRLPDILKRLEAGDRLVEIG